MRCREKTAMMQPTKMIKSIGSWRCELCEQIGVCTCVSCLSISAVILALPSSLKAASVQETYNFVSEYIGELGTIEGLSAAAERELKSNQSNILSFSDLDSSRLKHSLAKIVGSPKPWTTICNFNGTSLR